MSHHVMVCTLRFSNCFTKNYMNYILFFFFLTSWIRTVVKSEEVKQDIIYFNLMRLLKKKSQNKNIDDTSMCK